jgi:hypothetical protein
MDAIWKGNKSCDKACVFYVSTVTIGVSIIYYAPRTSKLLGIEWPTLHYRTNILLHRRTFYSTMGTKQQQSPAFGFKTPWQFSHS